MGMHSPKLMLAILTHSQLKVCFDVYLHKVPKKELKSMKQLKFEFVQVIASIFKKFKSKLLIYKIQLHYRDNIAIEILNPTKFTEITNFQHNPRI